MIIDSTMTQTIENSKLSNLEKLLKQQKNTEEQKVTFGLLEIQKFSLHISQEYQCIDFYDVEQGYIIICNTINSNHFKDQSNTEQIQFQSISLIHKFTFK